MKCRICKSEKNIKSYYPDILFNNKIFSYYKCLNCRSLNIYPNPTNHDLNLMYGLTDHKYLLTQNEIVFSNKQSRYNHQKYQIDFLKRESKNFNGKTLLDYGCGSGFYMWHAMQLGANAVGIEFSEDFSKILRAKTELNIYSLSEFKEKYKGVTFNYIHLGHILEHLLNPDEIFSILREYSNMQTIFLFDGPLDKNSNFARLIIDVFSRLRRRKYKEMSPQHLSLTNSSSQKEYFIRNGFIIDKFYVKEQSFPLPDSFKKSIVKSILFLFALTSIFISSFIKNWGNIFHCKAYISEKR